MSICSSEAFPSKESGKETFRAALELLSIWFFSSGRREGECRTVVSAHGQIAGDPRFIIGTTITG